MAVFHIAGRELRGIFNTAVGWLVLAGFLLICGFFWASMVSFYVIQATDMVANPYAGAQMSLNDHLLSPFFGNTTVVLLMVCPALSMRLFAEERKQGTLELLLTSPVRTLEIVVGKYLGAMAFVAVMLLGTAYVPLCLYAWAEPDWAMLAGGYAVLFLVAGAVLAMGCLLSALTSNQIVALVLTFAGSLALWVLSWAGGQGGETWMATFAEHVALVHHVEGLLKGAPMLSDFVYFAGFIFVFLFATHQQIEGYRWR